MNLQFFMIWRNDILNSRNNNHYRKTQNDKVRVTNRRSVFLINSREEKYKREQERKNDTKDIENDALNRFIFFHS